MLRLRDLQVLCVPISIEIDLSSVKIYRPYPGLDIAAGALPFFRRLVDAGAGVGVGSSGSVTFCRFARLEDELFIGSASVGDGSGSRVGALRFRDEVEGRTGGAGVGTMGLAALDASEKFAACRAEARVILEDMSICI